MANIVIRNLQKEFINRRKKRRSDSEPGGPGEKITVLNDINLEFKEGEMICILGPSGCGKSTMLRIIAGFDSDYAGEILIDNRPISGPSSENIFVFQHSGLLPWMTVGQNVELGLRHMSDSNEKMDKIREYIEMVDLEGFENHYPYQLSGGMQRRAELARALAVNPDMLIMDEPFSGLDFLTHMKMREEVVNMHEFIRKTTIVVTHDIDDALVMGDRIIVMSERPSKVALERTLDFPRPRAFDKEPEFRKLRDEIYLMLGVNYAV
jgi:ABC-type nitrate/sulfonate/bicarbonate transport system ATPase subunit